MTHNKNLKPKTKYNAYYNKKGNYKNGSNESNFDKKNKNRALKWKEIEAKELDNATTGNRGIRSAISSSIWILKYC